VIRLHLPLHELQAFSFKIYCYGKKGWKIPMGNQKIPKDNQKIPKGNQKIPKGNQKIPKGNQKIPKGNQKLYIEEGQNNL
jgi:hypothetical protein